MCRIFKIVYACGHRDIVTAPCEWRDEGRVDILGRRVACENSTRNLADLSRLCMACSLDSDEQNLVDLNSSTRPDDVDSYIACDEKDVVATIVRNESHLRRRSARMARVLPTPPISLGFPTSSELHHQLCMNGEFLARRLKRRYFRAHLDGRGEYQDFLEASQTHLDAKGALNNSIFTIEASIQATTSARTGQDDAAPAARTKTAAVATQTDDIEVAEGRPSHPSPPSSPESDDSSTTIRPLRPQAPSPPSARFLSEFLLDDEDLDFVLSREEGEENCSLIESSNVEPYYQEYLDADQVAELSNFVNGLSNEAERGRPRPESPPAKITLNSPKGIARLADIRLFLGMRSDTAPLDIWNFVIRNNDLMEFITGNTVPICHRNVGAAKRPGFDRDPGLETVLDYTDSRWELRTGFLVVWDSLDWTFETPSWPAHDAPGLPTDENDFMSIESTIDKSCSGFDVTKFVTAGIDTDVLNVEHETEQEDASERGCEEKVEGKEHLLEGRRARRNTVLGFDGKLRVPKHQVRNASPLRMSWKYTDLENPVSSPSSQDGAISPLPPPTVSWTFQDDTVEPMLSPPAHPASFNAPESPFVSALLSSLASSDDDAIPHISLEDSQVSVETENSPQQAAAQQGLTSWHAADDNNSDGPTAHSVLGHNGPPTVYESGSTVGKKMLDFLRQSLAIPDSRTPQEISTFIDLHPGLLRAIREGRVPVRKPATEVSGKKLRRRQTGARFDPLYSLPVAHTDRRQRFMQSSLAMALRGLDWDEIDSAPAPITPSSPCGDSSARADRKRFHGEDGDDDEEEEEECDHWVRTKVSPRRDAFSQYHSSYVMKHQVKTPSPLRTTLTRRGPEGGEVQVDAERGLPPAQGDTRELDSNVSKPEVWDDVDLNVSGSLPENTT